jgi:anti-sigma regulatory factor (Ser/Thr protein kinase)
MTELTEVLRQIDIPVGARSLAPLRDFFARCLDESGVAPDARRAITAALDASASAVALSADTGRRGTVSVTVDVNQTRLRVLVRDDTDGAELKADHAAGVLQHAARPGRELGLSLLRRVMDEVHYHYTRGFQNELELIKYL